ncbi:TetR/AcrR family transcriptional regulator; helix-turn-helix transcriptional regulator [Pseudonocardia sp. DSM 110487]|uniref:TetR/AcrR family transcriptional regulator n=1 Tax=Pseudonocardia sp. DSM 110487 TaxID=2865833 RepID=UPI001C6A3ADF|nr:TetR/AcrR family transcriptional regulator [Pseudonocardia sp. DSM 110487]QYN32299.1 TetR/AcrR family transcriptional regulator; helix-turn-helix transcriptional regulator [Pseudonocardia sp. DSM 110487]
MTGPVPRVRRDEVRRRLLDAAAEVFARRGFEAARLEEIAYAAGFTKGAVYSNFEGKHALLAELIDQHARTQLAVGTVEVRAQNRPESALEDIAEVFARRIVEESTWSRLLVEIAQRAAHDPEVRQVYVGVRRALRDELAAVLAHGCAQLGIELTVPAEQLALTLQALRMGLALEHGTDPDQVDQAAVTAVFTSTLRGVIRQPADKEIR